MAPAVLKPIIEQQGLSCLAVDLNIEVHNAVKDRPDRGELLDFFFHEKIYPGQRAWLHDLFESIAREILAWNPRYVGISLLSYVCQKSAKWVSYYLKKLNPDVIIILVIIIYLIPARFA